MPSNSKSRKQLTNSSATPPVDEFSHSEIPAASNAPTTPSKLIPSLFNEESLFLSPVSPNISPAYVNFSSPLKPIKLNNLLNNSASSMHNPPSNDSLITGKSPTILWPNNSPFTPSKFYSRISHSVPLTLSSYNSNINNALNHQHLQASPSPQPSGMLNNSDNPGSGSDMLLSPSVLASPLLIKVNSEILVSTNISTPQSNEDHSSNKDNSGRYKSGQDNIFQTPQTPSSTGKFRHRARLAQRQNNKAGPATPSHSQLTHLHTPGLLHTQSQQSSSTATTSTTVITEPSNHREILANSHNSPASSSNLLLSASSKHSNTSSNSCSSAGMLQRSSFQLRRKQGRTLLISSGSSQGKKSTILANLARPSFIQRLNFTTSDENQLNQANSDALRAESEDIVKIKAEPGLNSSTSRFIIGRHGLTLTEASLTHSNLDGLDSPIRSISFSPLSGLVPSPAQSLNHKRKSLFGPANYQPLSQRPANDYESMDYSSLGDFPPINEDSSFISPIKLQGPAFLHTGKLQNPIGNSPSTLADSEVYNNLSSGGSQRANNAKKSALIGRLPIASAISANKTLFSSTTDKNIEISPHSTLSSAQKLANPTETSHSYAAAPNSMSNRDLPVLSESLLVPSPSSQGSSAPLSGAALPSVAAHKPCNCKKSRCLKMYCDCYVQGVFCVNCNCVGCNNNPQNVGERDKALAAAHNSVQNNNGGQKSSNLAAEEQGNSGLLVHPNSLRARKVAYRGCNCKKSGCLKKYCECFQANMQCSDQCKCRECKNGKICTSHKPHPNSPPNNLENLPQIEIPMEHEATATATASAKEDLELAPPLLELAPEEEQRAKQSKASKEIMAVVEEIEPEDFESSTATSLVGNKRQRINPSPMKKLLNNNNNGQSIYSTSSSLIS
jgi:hypothetical protein